MASGTFSAADQYSDEIRIAASADLSLVFGDGTVKLQRFMNGDWRDVPNGEWTASTEDIVYAGSDQTLYRLHCSEHTSDIKWEINR